MVKRGDRSGFSWDENGRVVWTREVLIALVVSEKKKVWECEEGKKKKKKKKAISFSHSLLFAKKEKTKEEEQSVGRFVLVSISFFLRTNKSARATSCQGAVALRNSLITQRRQKNLAARGSPSTSISTSTSNDVLRAHARARARAAAPILRATNARGPAAEADL